MTPRGAEWQAGRAAGEQRMLATRGMVAPLKKPMRPEAMVPCRPPQGENRTQRRGLLGPVAGGLAHLPRGPSPAGWARPQASPRPPVTAGLNGVE